MTYKIKDGFVGETLEGLEGQVADTVVVDLSIRAENEHVWEPTRATVTVNGTKLPVQPGLISFEMPEPDPASPLVGTGGDVDVVLRFRVKAGGLTLNTKRRSS